MLNTTAAADLVLALACVGASVWLFRQAEPERRYAIVGMVLMGLAAALGTLRFAGVAQLEAAHIGVSRLTGAVAPPCFALVAAALGLARSRRMIEIGLGALVVGWVVFVLVFPLPTYRTAIGGLAVIVMLVFGLRDRSGPGLALGLGGLALALAGLVIGTKGTVGPMLAIDLFHLVLTLAHLLIAYGLVGLARR